ncbi:MAG TPA: hypothetical protein VK158_01110, partial [Acidobacteriota bacterium]|nr:hypothetical protein [Acidobacteriota bacterium]
IVCYGSGGEKSVARVLANAFNRPVIASTTEVLNVGFVLNPYGYVRQKNDRFYVATGIPTYNELRGDFSVVYPNPSRPTQ